MHAYYENEISHDQLPTCFDYNWSGGFTAKAGNNRPNSTTTVWTQEEPVPRGEVTTRQIMMAWLPMFKTWLKSMYSAPALPTSPSPISEDLVNEHSDPDRQNQWIAYHIAFYWSFTHLSTSAYKLDTPGRA